MTNASVEARIGERVIGTGIGHTKKAAEQEAAYQALLLLKPVQKNNAGNGVMKCI